MSEERCTLCDLPTPDPPVTDPQVEGTFCCEGCLQVYDLLQDLDEEEAERVRQETINRKHLEWEAEQPPESSQEVFLKVEGMHCTTCEAFIETMSQRQPGIYKSEASYSAELVKVYYDPEQLQPEELPALISKMGYSAHFMDTYSDDNEFMTIARLILGGLFGVMGLIIYIIFLYPIYITDSGIIPFSSTVQYFFIAQIFAMTSVVLFFTGWPILRGAWVSLSVMKPNMDLLIALAAVSAYAFSMVSLFSGSSEIYFDVTMAIILVVSFGNFYEQRMKKSKNSLLTKLMESRIKKARVFRDGSTQMIDLEDLNPGDRLMVRAGERIPVDGTVTEGEGVVNEALITGESLPVSKKPGDHAVSGTTLTQHALTIETGKQVESTIEKMIHLMWNIQAGHSGKKRLVDKIAAYFVPGVLVLGIGAFFLHYLSGTPAVPSLLAALAVLIVSCPCALGLATPLAVASGLRDALKNNIIFKTGAVFEEQNDTDILAFDKTGTLTTGRMKVINTGGCSTAFGYARAIEQYSSHPVAKAIAEEEGRRDISVTNFRSETRGVMGDINQITVHVGQPEWLEEHEFKLCGNQRLKVKQARQKGCLPTGVAWNGRVRSIIVVGDEIREEAASFIASLKKRGKKIAIITGDSEEASRPLREQLQPDYLFTGARPESKTEIIKKLQKFGTVAMIGDGSNDALALADADLGVAFGDLTAIAAESAQIVIPEDRLHKITVAFNAMRQTKKRIRQNLGWAFLYNVTAIPLAVVGVINPLYAALAMAASSLLVVSNSSRRMKFNDFE